MATKTLPTNASQYQDALAPEWFETQLYDATAVHEVHRPVYEDALISLLDLADAHEVLTRLKKVDWAFSEDDTSYLSHDIHPYPAKFIPQIPHNLITRLSMRGELVWDPFGGSGTTALEAILLDRRALSTDANPLAEVIGQAKTLTLIKEEEDELNDFVERMAILSGTPATVNEVLARNSAALRELIPDIPHLDEWFHPNAVNELAYILYQIGQLEHSKCRILARVCFSKTVLKASYQDEETRYARRPREVPSGSVTRTFTNNLAAGLRKVRQLGPLLRFRQAEFRTLDLREADDGMGHVAPVPGSVDLIVTSPPYPNSNDYHLYHRFRLFWLGHDPRDLGRKEIGSHLRHQREGSGFDSYLNEMAACLRNMACALRPGRFAVLVLGDAIFDGQITKTAEVIGQTAAECGLEYIGIIDRAVHQTKRSFVAAGRRLRAEQLLVLRKPTMEVELSLLKPSYRLWSYEEVLRKREIESLIGTDVLLQPSAAGDFSAVLPPLYLDRLRRLTFTRAIVAADITQEPTWQAVLENGDSSAVKSHRKDPKYVTHGIHAYKGKFYPQLAKSLFNLAGLKPGQRVLDPFCGSGTVLLEAYLNGLVGFGTDLNPLAVKIARAKTEILQVDPYLCDRLLVKLQERLRAMESNARWLSTFPAHTQRELVSWFPEPVLGKLGWLLNEISQVPDSRVREFLEVLVSSIVREISQQDPKDLRIRRRAESLTDAPVGELFGARLSELRQRLLSFSEKCNRSPVAFLRAVTIEGDCRYPDVFARNEILPRSIDAVVTSPPYATALPYIDTDRLSILLLFGTLSGERSRIEESLTGSREIAKADKAQIENRIDRGDFGVITSLTAQNIITEVRQRNQGSDGGFRKQNMAALLYRYFTDMSLVLANLNPLLAPGAPAFFVIGNTRTEAGGKIVGIESSLALQELGVAVGWDLLDVIPITVTTEDRLHNKNAITENDIIYFRKKP